ncbi:hypothetical protein [Nocardiopsis composta]|uniref:Uncharacterized protein n=1 Tax=Nocardiopsis composta TaxID=157465 RepID=A0A7W8VB43_9ACTN|nr:hypothetical protein [Nocardiopsis composta]MBB5429941.1 hypothetical protein [Nocardiopsis composta]
MITLPHTGMQIPTANRVHVTGFDEVPAGGADWSATLHARDGAVLGAVCGDENRVWFLPVGDAAARRVAAFAAGCRDHAGHRLTTPEVLAALVDEHEYADLVRAPREGWRAVRLLSRRGPAWVVPVETTPAPDRTRTLDAVTDLLNDTDTVRVQVWDGAEWAPLYQRPA